MDLIFVARSLANLFSRNCQNSSITKDQKLNVSNLTKDKYQVALGLLLLVFEVVSSGCFALHKVPMLMSMSLSTSMSIVHVDVHVDVRVHVHVHFHVAIISTISIMSMMP